MAIQEHQNVNTLFIVLKNRFTIPSTGWNMSDRWMKYMNVVSLLSERNTSDIDEISQKTTWRHYSRVLGKKKKNNGGHASTKGLFSVTLFVTEAFFDILPGFELAAAGQQR